ncbi:MAG: diguanylate cyclase [Gammaproteobacteria bacterium]|nr:diguanylate cyclase [Gammaproteobacteria bacterium]
MGWARCLLSALAISTCLVPATLAAVSASAAQVASPAAGPVVAIVQAPSEISLDQIVSGRAKIGFTPVVSDGIHAIGRPGTTIWLRIRTQLPADDEPRFVSLPRQAINSLRLHVDGGPGNPVASTGIAQTDEVVRWPDAFVLALPANAPRNLTLYLEIQGQGHLNLRPRVIDQPQWRERARASSLAYDLLYSGLFGIFVLAVARRALTGERTLRVAAAAFGSLCAAIVGNYHLQLSLGGTSLAAIPALPVVLWVMACAPLLWATQQYAGLEKTNPSLGRQIDRAGFALVLLALVILVLPAWLLPQMQVTGLLMVAATSLVCAAVLLSDPRQWRWLPALVWLAMVPAMAVIALGFMQLLPATRLVTRGFQLLLALLMVIYLFAPWIRSLMQERQRRMRGGSTEQSAEQKIAHAREWMIRSLQAGMENASDEGDMEWIAYRRLMGGLKPVLPQHAAAVIAMNYHNEDLLLVEPKTAEPWFQMLLAQRGSLLKNLSRSLAPQQIGVDFTGPDGPVQQALLAVIPLPIERPGWGVLVIERSTNVSYSDPELDLCTEFAALATTAGDEAATVMQLRQATEIEPESGVYRREMVEQLLRRAHESAALKRKPLSLMRVAIDGFDGLTPESSATVARLVADMVREEIDYGETISRVEPDQFLVLLSGRPIGEARVLADRICAAVRKLGLPLADEKILGLSIGVSQMLMGERSPQLALERAVRALAKARQYGGNQVQAVAGAGG